MAGNDIVYALSLNDQDYVQGMARVANSARNTANQIDRDAKRAQNAFTGRNAAQFNDVASNGLLFDPLAKTRMRDDMAIAARVEETYRKRNIERLFQEIDAEKKLGSARAASNAQLKGFVGTSNTGLRAIQQLSFGVEDAATQFGTMGLAGAIRGAGNNLSAAAMAFGPAASVAASLGVTVLMLGTNFLSAGDNAKKHAEQIKELEKEYRGLEAQVHRTRKEVELQQELRDIPKMGFSPAQSQIESLRKEMEKDEAEIKLRSENVARLAKSMTQSLLRDAEKLQNNPGMAAEFLDEKKLQADIDRYKKTLKMSDKEIAGMGLSFLNKLAKEAAETKDATGTLFSEETIQETRKQALEVAKLNQRMADNAKLRQELAQRLPNAMNEELKKMLLDKLPGGEKATAQASKYEEDRLKAAERYREITMTAEEKYQRELRTIRSLEKDKTLDPITARRAAERARMEMQASLNKGLHANIDLSVNKFTDARSAEALQNYYKHVRTAGKDVPSMSPVGNQNAVPVAPSTPPAPNFGWENTPAEKLVAAIGKAMRDAMKPSIDEAKKQTAAMHAPDPDPVENIANF